MRSSASSPAAAAPPTNQLKRPRSINEQHTPPPASDPLQIYPSVIRRAGSGSGGSKSSRSSWSSLLAASDRYESSLNTNTTAHRSSQSSSSPSPSPPPPSTNGGSSARKRIVFGSKSNSFSTSQLQSSLKSPSPPPTPAPSITRRKSYSQPIDEEEIEDPFADAGVAATQPLEDDDDAPTSKRPFSAATAPTFPRSVSLPTNTTTASVSRSNSRSTATRSPRTASTLQLSGSSRAKADELQFLIEGLEPNQSQSIRTQSAVKLLQLILSSTHTKLQQDEADGMRLLRTCNGFSTIADAIPDANEILAPENEIFATLFTIIAYLAAHDPTTNACFFTTRGLEILFTIAFQSTTSTLASKDEDVKMKDASVPASASTSSGVGRNKKLSTQQLSTAAELKQLFLQHSTSIVTKKIDGATKLHLDSLSNLDYLALISLTSLSTESEIITQLLHSSDLYTSDHIIRTLLQQLKATEQQLRQLSNSSTKSSSTAAGRSSKNKKPATHTSTFPDAYYLASHRLRCYLTILENCSHHDPTFASSLCQFGLAEERKTNINGGEAKEGVQTLFDVLSLLTPNIEQQQLIAPSSRAEASESTESNPSTVCLATLDLHSLSPIFSILRLFVNITNRNETGINALNTEYRSYTADHQVTGLQIIFDLMASIRWSFLSDMLGRPDMFNLISLTLPIIVNTVECSKESMRIIDKDCRQSRVNKNKLKVAVCVTMLPINAELTASALAALSTATTNPPSPIIADGSISALDFTCSLWSYLHQQLQLLDESIEAREAQQQEIKRSNGSVDDADSSFDHDMNEEEDPNGQQIEVDPVHEAEAEVNLGLRTLASLCSILLGFFATSSSTLRSSILRNLRLTSFNPLIKFISEFILLQSASQVQSDGLEATLRMVESLKRFHQQQQQESSPMKIQTTNLHAHVSDDEDDDGKIELAQPTSKRQKLTTNSSPSSSISHASMVNGFANGGRTTTSNKAAPTLSTFDQLFNSQRTK